MLLSKLRNCHRMLLSARECASYHSYGVFLKLYQLVNAEMAASWFPKGTSHIIGYCLIIRNAIDK